MFTRRSLLDAAGTGALFAGAFSLFFSNQARAQGGAQEGLNLPPQLPDGTRAEAVLDAIEALLSRLQISKDEFHVNDFDVVQRVDTPGDVVDVFVVKHTHNFRYRVYFTNVLEKLIPEPLPLRGTFDESGDIDKFDNGRHNLLRVGHFAQRLQTVVRHRNDSYGRVDGTKRIVLGRHALLGECIKKRGFSHVWQTDNAKRE